MTKVVMMMPFFVDPIRVAVSGDCATARMPRPSLVREINWSVNTIITRAAVMIVTSCALMITPPMSKTGVGATVMRVGSGSGERQIKIEY